MAEKYYISNKMLYVRGSHGSGCPQTEPENIPVSSATHFSNFIKNAYLEKHPECNVIPVKSPRGNVKFIISTPQKFLGVGNVIVESIRDAMSFSSAADAIEYLNHNGDVRESLLKQIGDLCIINNRYIVLKVVNAGGLVWSQPNNATKRRPVNKTTRAAIAGRKHVCYLCGKEIPDSELTIDHILPVSRGGKNNVDNLRLAHRMCNLVKASLTPDEFLTTVGDIAANFAASDVGAKVIRAMVRGILNSKNV